MISGMCKHMHTALILAADKGFDVDEHRSQKAASLFEVSAYSVEYPYLTVFDDSMGIDNMETMLCNCVACSHGINCICKRTADLVLKEGHDETHTYPVVNQSCIDQSETGHSHIRKFKDILAVINTWAETTDSALGFIRRLYACDFSKFPHVYRHKHLASASLQKIGKAKQTLTVYSDNDHSYGEKTQRQCRRSVRPQSMLV